VFTEDGATTRTFRGRTFGLQLRKVCRSCNGGWMGRLESQAKPVLTPMILGRQQSTLSIDDQATIANWVAKL
jgi:hypothetical protein